MKNKTMLLSVILMLIIFLGGMIAYMNFNFARISGTLVSLDSKSGAIQIDFSTPSVKKSSLEDYSRTYPAIFILKEPNREGGFDVYSYEAGIKKHIFFTDKYIWEQPILMDNGDIFFIASDSSEDYEKALLFIYSDTPNHFLFALPNQQPT